MYESSTERWSPAQSIEKILISIVSMLAEPNIESPANVDAAVCIIILVIVKKRNLLLFNLENVQRKY